MRKRIAGAVLALMVSGPAAAQSFDIDNWQFTEGSDFCSIETFYSDGDGANTSFAVGLDWIDSWVIISRSVWNFSETTASAEIWIGRDIDRPADQVKSAVAKGDSIWINVGDALVEQIAATDYVAVRVAGTGVSAFEGFDLGVTAPAVAEVFDCADYLY